MELTAEESLRLLSYDVGRQLAVSNPIQQDGEDWREVVQVCAASHVGREQDAKRALRGIAHRVKSTEAK